MKFRLLFSCVGTVALSFLTFTCAFAQEYPSKPIQFVVMYPPGGASDVVARVLGQKLGDAWKQSVLTENRPVQMASSPCSMWQSHLQTDTRS